MFGTWVYHHGTMCRVHLWPWPLTSISKLYFHHESGKMSLLFDIGIRNFGITMRQHVVYILDLSMTLTFDLYVCGWRGILSEFYSQFFLSCFISTGVPCEEKMLWQTFMCDRSFKFWQNIYDRSLSFGKTLKYDRSLNYLLKYLFMIEVFTFLHQYKI